MFTSLQLYRCSIEVTLLLLCYSYEAQNSKLYTHSFDIQRMIGTSREQENVCGCTNFMYDDEERAYCRRISKLQMKILVVSNSCDKFRKTRRPASGRVGTVHKDYRFRYDSDDLWASIFRQARLVATCFSGLSASPHSLLLTGQRASNCLVLQWLCNNLHQIWILRETLMIFWTIPSMLAFQKKGAAGVIVIEFLRPSMKNGLNV
ncbi:hypothetical protein ARMSODRAFT_983445 [Armillaria solidipes]|uniref:Uncharacterized protein n=1 Tax=Armillaria solidipes TaxID=1076256 RepID=A0A2H3AVM4_9AGAR|nr:hypothetical protein ARMSODRAFT_983445 [Armillaria solidipes]